MKCKKIVAGIILILVFLCFLNINISNAALWGDDDKKSDIEKTIENEKGGLFENIIAKMIRWSCRNYIRFDYKRRIWSWF